MQAPEPRAPGDTAQDPVLPPGQAEAGRAQDSKDAPAPAEQTSSPAPQSLQALQTEISVVTEGAESRFPELAPPLGLFLLGPHRVNNPH